MDKTKKYFAKKAAALFCCFAVLFAMLPLAGVEARADSTLGELNSQYEELEQQQKELQSKIDSAKSEKAKQEAIKNKQSQDISILKSQISVLEEKIAFLEQEITAKEEEIESLSGQIDENYELFKKRIRAMYMSDNTSTLGLVLGADSFSDFLVRSEYLKRVAEHDQELLDSLNTDKEALEEAKTQLEADQADLDASKASVEQKKAELDKMLAATVQEIQNISKMEQEFLANKEALQKEMKQVQAEIDAIYAAMDNSGNFVGGGFMYPVPGYKYISSYFGWRFNGTDYHTGVDFTGSGVNGKSVVASNSGTVSFTKSTYVPGQGYGKYMIIDHGGGYSTLYAHLSSINRSVGDYVSKGSNIANVGSTGWSTGPHLHFEVRVNGVAQNPLNYLN